MTRLFAAGVPVVVVTGQRGELLAFVWEGRRHRVERMIDHWRVDVLWWRVRIWRETYRVTTDTGLLVVLYRDLLDGGWYVQRVYD